MRIAFAGTPEFAAVALRALIEAGHEIALVLTQPDRPSGRGMKFEPGPVKQLALDHAIRLHQPASLRLPETHAPLIEAKAEVIVVAAYGLILPPPVLALPTRGCLNIHASLLPRWRGAAPVQRAILTGDTESGVSVMQMETGLDTGVVLLSCAVTIAADETGGTLTGKLAQLGAGLIVEVLHKLPAGELRAVAQPTEGVTYAHKLSRQEAEIDWSQPAEMIERKVRAFNPFPVAQTRFRDQFLKLWQVRAEAGFSTTPGQVLRADSDGILVACGAGALAIVELQQAGGKRLSAAAFLAGNRIEPGEVFASRPLNSSADEASKH